MENINRTDVVPEESLPFMDGKPFSEDLFIIEDDKFAELEDEYFRTMEWLAWGR